MKRGAVSNRKRSSMIEFKAMLGPWQDYPPGSPERALRLSAVLQNRVQSDNQQTSPWLIRHLRQLFAEVPRPWSIWPDPPFNTPDDYCKAVTGHDWASLIALVQQFSNDRELANMMTMELARAQSRTVPKVLIMTM